MSWCIAQPVPPPEPDHDGCIEIPEEWRLLPQKLTVRVIDDQGKPVEEANVVICMNDVRSPRGGDIAANLSDAEGRASHEARGNGSAEFWVRKEGYYSSTTFWYHFDQKPLLDGLRRGDPIPQDFRFAPWNPEVEVVLVEKKDPVTMRDLWGIRLPEFDREFGYDLLVGDLVAPHGEGMHADLLLRTELETFEDEMDIVVLEMEFTGQGNGMMRVEELPFPDSEFKYLRQAPEDGYETRTLRTGRLNRGLHRQNPDAEQVEQLRELYRSKVPIPPDHPEAWVFRIRQDKAADGEGPHYGIFVKPSREGPPLRFNAATVAALAGTSAAPSEPTINLSIRGVVNPIVGSRSLEVGPRAPRDPRRMVLPPGVPPPPPPPE